MVSTTKKYSQRTYCKLALLTLGLVVFACVGTLPMAKSREAAQETAAPKTETAQPQAAVPKTILDLQAFRQTSSTRIKSDKGMQGMATLVNLNPAVNAWYLLQVDWQGGSKSFYHLENPQPRSQKLLLDPKYPSGIEILEGNAHHPCNLFAGGTPGSLQQARNSPAPYASLCDGRLFLRNPAKGIAPDWKRGRNSFAAKFGAEKKSR